MSWCARMWAGLAIIGSANEDDTICNSRSEKAVTEQRVANWGVGIDTSVWSTRRNDSAFVFQGNARALLAAIFALALSFAFAFAGKSLANAKACTCILHTQ
eukprot:scaffold30114_cov84-Phaeocystis_antarctica.AAC.1